VGRQQRRSARQWRGGAAEGGDAAVYLVGTRSVAVRDDGTLWIWGAAFSGGQGLLGRNLEVPTRSGLP
jgi:hypothetical protein